MKPDIENNQKGKLLKNYSMEFVLSTLAQCIYLFQSVVQNKIFTSFFPVSVYGEWSILISVYTLISMIPFSACDQGVYKIAYRYREKNNERELITSISITYVFGFIIYSLFFIVGRLFSVNAFFLKEYIFWFLLYAFTEIFKNSFIIIDNAYRNRRRVLTIRIFEFFMRIIVMLLFYLNDVFSIKAVLILMSFTNFIIYGIQLPLLRKIKIFIEKQIFIVIWKEIGDFSYPLLTWAVFGWMQNMISRWYLEACMDYNSVALYSVLTSISFFVPNMIYQIANSYIIPIVYSKGKGFTKKKLKKFVGFFSCIFMSYLIFICAFGKYFILIFSSDKYLSILKYLPLTTISSIVYILSMLSTIEIYRTGKTKKLLFSTITPGILMSTIGYLLIKYSGFNGAIINYMMGHFVYAILTFKVTFNKDNLLPETSISK